MEYIHETPYVEGQVTHCWLPTTCYENLTVTAIRNSVETGDSDLATNPVPNKLPEISSELVDAWLCEEK